KQVFITDWDISSVLPGEPKEFSIKISGSSFALRIKNPMKNGKSLLFANETQQKELLILK
ncbi:MAG: hypothetical protein NE327_23390, partial [Lentisphaeraceae bacterium]|nr:hypothetical protein [Lentisphaeraceae bacterium]